MVRITPHYCGRILLPSKTLAVEDKDYINHPPPLSHTVTRVRGTRGAVRRSFECHEKLSNSSYCLTRTVRVKLVRPIKWALSRFLNIGCAIPAKLFRNGEAN